VTYHTAFDLAEQPPFSMAWALLSAAFIGVGILLWWWRRAKDRELQVPPQRHGWSTAKVLIVFGSLMAIVGVGLMSLDHWRLMHAIENGEARVVEGPIQSYGTERVRTANDKKQEYRTYERFYIGDSVWFGYYWDASMAGFYNQFEPRVPFKDGMMVRASYLYADGTDDPPRIVKLEVAE
jgi:hypothetical protein